MVPSCSVKSIFYPLSRLSFQESWKVEAMQDPRRKTRAPLIWPAMTPSTTLASDRFHCNVLRQCSLPIIKPSIHSRKTLRQLDWLSLMRRFLYICIRLGDGFAVLFLIAANHSSYHVSTQSISHENPFMKTTPCQRLNRIGLVSCQEARPTCSQFLTVAWTRIAIIFQLVIRANNVKRHWVIHYSHYRPWRLLESISLRWKLPGYQFLISSREGYDRTPR